MLTAKKAAAYLLKVGEQGGDDPTEPSRPVRWYWNEDGQLCRAFWRGCPEPFPLYRPAMRTGHGASEHV